MQLFLVMEKDCKVLWQRLALQSEKRELCLDAHGLVRRVDA